MSEEATINNSADLDGELISIQTAWANPPTVRDLKGDLQEAKPHNDAHISEVHHYIDNLYVKGTAKVKTAKGNSEVAPKVIRKQAEWRYSALTEPFLSTNDVFNVAPKGHMDRQGAIQNQLVLNNQFNTQLDKVNFIDEYVRTAVDEGTAIVRVGWEYEEETVKQTVPQFEFLAVTTVPEAMQIERLIKLYGENPELFQSEVSPEYQQAVAHSLSTGEYVLPHYIGDEVVEVTNVIRNQPSLEICDYRNVIIDPSCGGDYTKARFVIHSFESSLADLKADGKYKNLDKINISQASPLSEPDHATEETNFNFKDEPRKKFVVHEYWGFWDINKDGSLVPIVAAWVGDVMIRLEENPYPDQELPFVFVRYLPKRRTVFGEPDGALLEDNQKIIGAVTRGMIDIMAKSANGQTGVRKDALDAINRRKFLQGRDYEFNGNVDPRQAFYMHTYPEIPASAFNMIQYQNNEAEALTGVQAFNNGISGQSLGEVAAGIRGALDAASKREMNILRRLADGIVKIGYKLQSMNAEFLSDEEIIQITDEQTIAVKREALAGKYDLELSISTPEEDNAKAQELAFMLQTMGNNMDAEMAKLILAEIARLRKMPDLAKQIEKFTPQPDPLEQQKLQLEIQILAAQLAEIQSRTLKNQTGAQLDQSKTVTEGAKAENLQSETDLNSLQFVEQESGVTQARDLQSMGEQARSNAQLELVKHQLKQLEGAQQPSAQ